MEKFDWPIVGHAKIQQILQKSLVNKKLAHAYLFSGSAHLGKSLLAENFMASILCNDYHQQKKIAVKKLPCNECAFCQQFAKKIHPDVFYLDKAEGKKNISVEQVRAMQNFLSLTSFLNSYKIAVVSNAHDLSESGQNALLKILEEPSPKTILILSVNDYNHLLPTIVSRCQLIKFRHLSADDIFTQLTNSGSNREQANILTALSGGQIGVAIRYLQNPELYTQYLNKLSDTLSFFDQDLAVRFKSMENFYQQSKNMAETADSVREAIDFWQLILRDVLFTKNNLNNLLINLQAKDKIKEIAGRFTVAEILNLLALSKQIKQYLNFNINPRLAVENLLIKL